MPLSPVPTATALHLVQVWVATGPSGYRALVPALGLATDYFSTKPAALQAAGVTAACMPHAQPVPLHQLSHPAEALSGGYSLRLS